MERRGFAALPLAAVLPAQGQPRRLILVNAVYPPFVHPPGHAAGEGLDIEIARTALRRGAPDGAGYEVELQLLPWKRALLMLENGLADFTTTTSRSTERERFLAFSLGYRQALGYRFFARRDSPHTLRQLADLKGRSLGLSAGHFYPGALLQAPTARTETGKDIAATVQLLLAGRVDFIAVQAVSGPWQIRDLGLGPQLQAQPYAYQSDSRTCMAFARARPGHEAALAAMNAGLQALQRDGGMARLEQRYIGAAGLP